MTGHFILRQCPKPLITDQSRRAIRLAGFAQLGILPRSGGLDDQRHRDIRLIEMAQHEIHDLTNDTDN